MLTTSFDGNKERIWMRMASGSPLKRSSSKTVLLCFADIFISYCQDQHRAIRIVDLESLSTTTNFTNNRSRINAYNNLSRSAIQQTQRLMVLSLEKKLVGPKGLLFREYLHFL